jgi:hypothetical protein
MLYCRLQPRGGARFAYNLYEARGDSGGHFLNEIKVMVPCQEYREAQDVLRELDLLTPGSQSS